MTVIFNVGISGTRFGANSKQLVRIIHLLRKFKRGGARLFRHGDCIGVDLEAAEIARELGYKIIKHPGPRGEGSKADFIMPVLPFLHRNKIIVKMSDVMLIVPKSDKEVLRSGTWATYRYAMSMNVLVKIVHR